MSHRYRVKELVRLSGGRTTAGSLFEVVRLMPADETGEATYRVRESGPNGLERAVRESEISSRLVP